jgi:uncharacterized protein YydD (DUF2326 family)
LASFEQPANNNIV